MFDGLLEFVTAIGPGGVVVLGLLVSAILVGAAREWWVWGHVYRREHEEKIYWRDKTFEAYGLTERSLEITENVLVEEMP